MAPVVSRSPQGGNAKRVMTDALIELVLKLSQFSKNQDLETMSKFKKTKFCISLLDMNEVFLELFENLPIILGRKSHFVILLP